MNSKKPFDHIEDKIKQAAEHNLPPFDEKAWQLMEARLDREQKKRKPFLWWLVLPLLLAGSWGIYEWIQPAHKNFTAAPAAAIHQQNDGSKHGITDNTADTGNNSSTAGVPNGAAITGDDAGNNKPEDVTAAAGASVPLAISGASAGSTAGPAAIGSGRKRRTAGAFGIIVTAADISGKNLKKATAIHSSRKKSFKRNAAASLVTSAGDMDAVNEIDTNTASAAVTESPDAMVAGNAKSENILPPDKKENAVVMDNKLPEVKAVEKQVDSGITEKKKEKDRTARGWYLLAAGGADAGSTKFMSLGNSNVTPKYGGAIGYSINNRLSVQAGFYVGTKKYKAAPADYTIKPGSQMGVYPLESIKASNLVYEIPLLVRYDFMKKQSYSLYATAGVSSYILQKESYDCYYRYYNYVYEHNWQYNGNRHLFSTGVFSLGIEKALCPQLGILAEPSFSIPLKGVGDGSMKIYSASLMLGLKYYFFKPR